MSSEMNQNFRACSLGLQSEPSLTVDRLDATSYRNTLRRLGPRDSARRLADRRSHSHGYTTENLTIWKEI